MEVQQGLSTADLKRLGELRTDRDGVIEVLQNAQQQSAILTAQIVTLEARCKHEPVRRVVEGKETSQMICRVCGKDCTRNPSGF